MKGTAWKLIPMLAVVSVLMFIPQNVFSASQTRLMYGSVYNITTGQPVAGVIVTASSCGYTQSTSTSNDGSWQIMFPDGKSGTLTFSAPGYKTESFQINLNANWPYAGGVISLQPASS